ncbi:phosphodiester glycosidase family protein [Qipengyuania sp. JC766]|uniref:phosphodiester glycosidase family protein n=1 Tax=Qipengyuania sp. JC766 TaxID=3232139 RepID=UPI00345B3F01
MRTAVLLLALGLAACNPAPEGEPVITTEIGGGSDDGAEIASPEPASTPMRASDCKPVSFEGARLTHCIADPAKHAITTDLGPDDGAPYRSFAALSSGRGASAPPVAFAMNGGMFEASGDPVGYYVEDAERLVELNRNDGPGNFHLKPNGVFFGSNGSWRVLDSETFYRTVGDRPQFGTQSGPMLVIDGTIHPEISEDGPSKALRNGVGVDAQGRAHFVISESPVSFGLFARYFRDEAKTPNALFLDGNVSSLWDPASGRRDARAPLGPIIVVETKQ